MKLKEIRTRHIIKGLNKLVWDYMFYMFLICAVVIAVKPGAFLGTMEYTYSGGVHTFASFIYQLQSKVIGLRDWIVLAMIFELVRTNWGWIEKNMLLQKNRDNSEYLNKKFIYARRLTKFKRMIRW